MRMYLTVGLIKKNITNIYIIYKYILSKISQFFPQPYENSGRNIKVELHLSNYAKKS